MTLENIIIINNITAEQIRYWKTDLYRKFKKHTRTIWNV